MFFISYAQEEGGVLAERFRTYVTQKAEKKCWMDVYEKDRSEQGMREGVKECDVLIAFMTKSYLQRPFCQKELHWAQEFGKRVFVVIDAAHKSQISNWRLQCPPGYEWLFDITFANLDASDVRLWEATMPIHVEDAMNSPFAPPLQEQLRQVQAEIAMVKSDSFHSKADTQSAGTFGDGNRLDWLRSAVKKADGDNLAQEDEPEILGKGGQASIEIATYCGNQVALKVYELSKKDAASQERAYTEALLMGAISQLPVGAHHVVPLTGVHTEVLPRNVNIGLVLELSPQGSLDAIVAGSEPPRFWHGDADTWFNQREQYVHDREQGWISGMADGIRFLHEDLKLTHCDMKPANILLFDDGKTPKLTDFGSCILKSKTHWHGSMSVATMRGAGFTVRYQAPERITDELAITPKVDVWSFGLILYEILFGSRAWLDQTDEQLFTQKSRDVAGLLTSTNTAWTPGPLQASALSVMEKCLVVDPASRPDMSDITRLLRSPESVIDTGHGDAGPDVDQPVEEVEEVMTPGALTAAAPGAQTKPNLHQTVMVEGVVVKGVCRFCNEQVTSAQPREKTAEGEYQHARDESGQCITDSAPLQPPKTTPKVRLSTTAEHPEEKLRDRLHKFYSFFSIARPEDEVERIANRHAERMDELNKKLRHKYFADLTSSDEELAVAKKRVLALEAAEPIKAKLTAFYQRIEVHRNDSDVQNIALFHVDKEQLLNDKLRDKYAADLTSNEQELSSAFKLQSEHHARHAPPPPQPFQAFQPQQQPMMPHHQQPHHQQQHHQQLMAPQHGFAPPQHLTGMPPMMPHGFAPGPHGMPPMLPSPMTGPPQPPPPGGGGPAAVGPVEQGVSADVPAVAEDQLSGLLMLRIVDRENDMALTIITDIENLY